MTDQLTSLFLRFREHGDLRALARLFDEVAPEVASVAAHMARSPDEAEDLVQATFLTAIERSACFDATRPVVPWLLGMLAMHARKQRERAGRDLDLERVRQPAEADPESDAERSEIASAVGSAVEKLGANYAPLVRRYLVDGATPAALAREFELSPITARVRLHRGLKQLRKVLPVGLSVAAFGVATRRLDLRAMRASLLKRAAEITGAPVPVASLASGALVLALMAPVAVALPVWLLWPKAEANEASLTAVAPATAAPEAGLVSSTAAALPRALAEALEPAPEPVAAAVATPAAPRDGQAHVRGRMLRPDGAPAAGAVVKLTGGQSSEELVEKYGLPASWTAPPPIACSETGDFDIGYDSPLSYQFYLDAETSGCAKAKWRWVATATDQVTDLGEVRLEAGGTLVVRIVDEHGQALGQGWTVSAHSTPPDSRNGREGVYTNVKFDPSSPEFALSALPARRVELSAGTDLLLSIPKRAVDVIAGASTPVELVYHGPDPLRRIALRMVTPPGMIIGPGADHIWLSKPGMAAVHPLALQGRLNEFVFDALDPGAYEVRIDDSRFEAWHKVDVQPGTLVRPKVRGNAAVRISIFNADQTPYVGPFGLDLSKMGSSTVGGVRLVSVHDAPPDGGLVSGFLPGDYELELSIPGRKSERLVVSDLAAQETRNLSIVLPGLAGSMGIQGRVVANDGTTPMAGIDVQLTRGEIAGHDREAKSQVFWEHKLLPPIDSRTTTDAQGRFHFDGLQPGAWTVRARWSKWLAADRICSVPATAPLELVQPPCGMFTGQLLLPAGVPIDDVSLCVSSMNPGVPPNFNLAMKRDPSEIAEDGTFHIGPIPPGQITVDALLFTEFGLGEGRGGTGPSLGQFTIEAGAPIPHELDLRATLPCRLHGRVVLDGVAAHDGTVGVYEVSAAHERGNSHTVSLDGLYLIGYIPPNSPVRVRYTSATGWAWAAPSTLQLEAASDTEFAISIATAEHELQLLDAATNLPRANQRIAWRTGPDFAASPDDPAELERASATSDAQGKLRVRLPLGQARFVALPSGTLAPATVDWTADAAPLVLRVQ